MNFYPHHIGDFNNSTRHLTRVERSVYRDAIELYYDTESLLSVDLNKLQKKLICRNDEEKQALIDVLDEFFELQDDGYFHERCQIEIDKYRANKSAKAKAGIASAKARKQKATESKQKSTGVKLRSTNQEPITSNQEPINKTICLSDIENEFADLYEKQCFPKTDKARAFNHFKKLVNKMTLESCRTFKQMILDDMWKRFNFVNGRSSDFKQKLVTYLSGRTWEDEAMPNIYSANNSSISNIDDNNTAWVGGVRQ